MVLSTATAFFGDRVWTPDDLDDAMGDDEDWRRYEIVDGVLVVSPHAVIRHQVVVAELMTAVRPAVLTGFHLIGSVGIGLGRSYRVTDLTVVADRAIRADAKVQSPADILLAVEIESPSSITTDRITKPAQYAAAGIEHYWRVEMDPLRLHTYRLAGDVYEATGSWGADEIARVTGPFTVDIDLSTLLPYQPRDT